MAPSGTAAPLGRGPVLAPDLGSVLSSARELGGLGPKTVLHLSLGLDGRDGKALGLLLDQGRTVPALEYDDRFGPAPRRVVAMERWLRAEGLDGSWSPGDAVLQVQGPAAAVESVFSVSLARYRAPGPGGTQLSFYAPSSRPSLPPAGDVVSSVLGLDDYPVLAGPERAAAANCPGASARPPSEVSPPTRCPGFTTSARFTTRA